MVILKRAAVTGAVLVTLGGPLAAGILALSSPSAAWAATSASASASTSCTKSDVDIVSRNSDLTTVSVKLAAGSGSVSCDVSLHSYETQGPTWATSGQQKLIGFATVHLTTTAQTLSVTSADCFGQSELVIGTTRFDGVDGPLPHYPNGVFDSKTVLDLWHGGSACATPSPSPSVSPSVLPQQTSATPSPSASSSVSPTVSPSVLPMSTSTASTSVAPMSTVSPTPSPSVLGLTLTRSPQQPTLPFTGAPVLAEVSLGFGLLAGGTLCGMYAWRRRASGAGS